MQDAFTVVYLFLAYAAFILLAALPTLLPVIAIAFLVAAAAAFVQARGRVLAVTAGVLCTALAGFLGLVIFNVDDRIPGTKPLRELRIAVAQQQRAQRALAPGGEFDRLLRDSRKGNRT